MDTQAALKTHRATRSGADAAGALRFVVQKHWASSLHYDLRLQLADTMKSWAVPKGPSLDPADKRLAVPVEDHPIAYADFEGTIPEGRYGAGKVIVWDQGHWTPVGDAAAGLRAGRLTFELQGHKLRGRWTLVRMQARGARPAQWLLRKEQDGFARPAAAFSVVDAMPDSVRDAGLAAGAAQPLAARVRVSHPERVIDARSGATKRELVQYYALVGTPMMVHLRGRPVSLVRAPGGVGKPLFFQKHAEVDQLPGLRQLDAALDPAHPPMLAVASPRGLLSAAQWNAVEIHTMNALARRFDRPDRMVFDLDPGAGVTWRQMQQGAQQVQAFLQQLGLPAFLKTSGGKGLHIVVPLRRQHGWALVKDVAQAIVRHVARTQADRFVAKSGPRNRVGKIFIDYLRNGQGATTVCAWSVRARPGLGISVPLAWDELDAVSAGDAWNIRNVHDRLGVGNAPWDGYARAARSLTVAMRALDVAP